MGREVNITNLKKRVDGLDNKVKIVNSKISKKEKRATIKNYKYFELKKAIVEPNFERKTVLTDSTWDYVLTYIQSNSKNSEAIFYWRQAKNFYDASIYLNNISSPLTIYYCFLNATKALLIFKGRNFDLKHGVSGERRDDGRAVLNKEIIKIHPSGVLAGLSDYLEDNTNKMEKYNLKDILYNIPYIHRAYTLINKDTELFIPIIEPRFVFDKDRGKGWFEIKLENEYSNKKSLNKIKGYSIDKYYNDSYEYILRRNKTFKWICNRNRPDEESIENFNTYHKKIRKQLEYIYSPNELWYFKRNDLKETGKVINRNTLVLTFAAMHKLSELARYEPNILKKYLEKDQNWVISEFINKSLVQFIDNISSEITGDDFRQTGFRT
ncbi:YaaC family protein [Clostridium gasigenes]|uniref:YaaC family protein n=1 Tax=Clostridium gasigenes TaxID=94869 RepID=UPI001C0D0FE8|nr:YaaC family protein [Clostridium gasigenes]MBU3135815.1 YaaC family protein [Clostridium gasigenes]